MARRRHLKNAPIKEALIDIQFEPIESIAPIREFSESVSTRFNRIGNLWQASLGVQFAPAAAHAASSVTPTAVGMRLDSDERKHVLQLRLNGFTFSRLHPYQDWNEIRDAARELWSQYSEKIRRQTITRMAVRYINSLPLPLPMSDFSDYLSAPPQVPAALPQGVTSFLQRVVTVDPKGPTVGIVTQAMEDPGAGAQPSTVNIFLDIDCFREKEALANSSELWANLEELRELKNAIFFEHITEKTAELFE